MTLNVLLMQDLDLRGKRVLIREDLNVPVKQGVVTSDARIRAALPTIEAALSAGAKVLLMSHLGRPVEGEFNAEFSLAPVAQHLSGLLGKPVALVTDWRGGVTLADGAVALLENVRFNPGEKKDDEARSRRHPRTVAWHRRTTAAESARAWNRSASGATPCRHRPVR